jgi:hypothetical protein
VGQLAALVPEKKDKTHKVAIPIEKLMVDYPCDLL